MKCSASTHRKRRLTPEVPLRPSEIKNNVLEELLKLKVLQCSFQLINFIVLRPLRKWINNFGLKIPPNWVWLGAFGSINDRFGREFLWQRRYFFRNKKRHDPTVPEKKEREPGVAGLDENALWLDGDYALEKSPEEVEKWRPQETWSKLNFDFDDKLFKTYSNLWFRWWKGVAGTRGRSWGYIGTMWQIFPGCSHLRSCKIIQTTQKFPRTTKRGGDIRLNCSPGAQSWAHTRR